MSAASRPDVTDRIVTTHPPAMGVVALAPARHAAHGLLARATRVGRCDRRCAAPRIDVEAAAARVARVHAEARWRAASHHVDEDALDAVLMEFRVLAERNQVAQP